MARKAAATSGTEEGRKGWGCMGRRAFGTFLSHTSPEDENSGPDYPL